MRTTAPRKPSEILLEQFQEKLDAGEQVTQFNASFAATLVIIDKLEELCQLLRAK